MAAELHKRLPQIESHGRIRDRETHHWISNSLISSLSTFSVRACTRNWRNRFIARWLCVYGVEVRGIKPWCTGRLPSIHIDKKAQIIVGSACTFGSRARLAAYGTGMIDIGDGAFINTYAGAIIARTRITIGAHSLIADHVVISDDSFHDVSPDSPRRLAPITIGRNVWLSSYVRVLPGVTIGDHTVVGANAVVTHSLPDRCLAVGAPARVVRTFQCADDWCRR